jgi:hypothetical protein
MRFRLMALAGLLFVFCSQANCQGFSIFIDYQYDTNNFFSTQERRDALQAAANRWSDIITSPLTAVGPSGTGSGTSAGWRIGFNHPATGASFQVSTAANSGSDPLSGGGLANQYGFAGLAANQWILYAGGRNLGTTAGIGGTGTGLNFTSTFNDLQGPMHRGVISNTPANTVNDIPAWGGSIAFNTNLSNPWHFGINTAAPSGSTDFYTIALHEIGHALGLSITFNQWTAFQSSATFTGPKAVAAYNLDNGTNVSALNTVSSSDFHWQNNTQLSRIFDLGNPNYTGTVGAGVLQDLLMDPIANFTPTIRRLELTNVDIGALGDLGWGVVAIPELSSLFYLGGLLVLAGHVYYRRMAQVRPASQSEAALAEPDAQPLSTASATLSQPS